MTADSPAPAAKQIVYLNRRVAFIEPGRINVRPALAAALFPLIWLLLGIGCAVSILLWLDRLPFALVRVLLVAAVVSIPLAGIGFVYALGGANVVFDREKQSGLWQQGFLGMGVGTTELVPFWKIAEIRIEETTREQQRGEPQDVAQFEVVLVVAQPDKPVGRGLKLTPPPLAFRRRRRRAAPAGGAVPEAGRIGGAGVQFV